jgi:ubiquinone/menaquinone biosynthesis C-methylase UbiE
MAPRFIARQLSFPNGLLGRIMGLLMNFHNAHINEFAIQKMTVRPPGKILEIGFGGGLSLARLIGLSRHFSGVDRSDEMVSQAKLKFRKAIENGQADFCVGNVEALPFAAQTFGNVLTVNTVYFWKSLEVGCNEIRRVLASSGQAVIGFMPREHMEKKKMPPDIFSLRTTDDVATALRSSGFSETHVERPEAKPEWAVVLATK